MLFNNWKQYLLEPCMSIQPFTMGVDWLESGRLMEVSIIFDIFAHTVFLLSTAEMQCIQSNRKKLEILLHQDNTINLQRTF